MILRVGLLIVGALLFVFLAWGAITTWITVFSEGAGTSIDVSGPGNDRGEGPALVGAIVFTLFALLAGAAAVVAGVALAKGRR
ncbi:hypothetical protein ACFC1W_03735 [Microbacterium sp. NPDC056003]|jgi:hypothetical protein|uniref:hypothetical protein n=1 Tax=Microbacterium sp. NPDC056003 TaxID=3345676 RepID=UPI0035DAF085